MTTLGVVLAGDIAWLAVVDPAGAVAAEPDRYQLPSRPRAEALPTALEDASLMYQREEVTAVGLLDAQGNARPNSYQQVRPGSPLSSCSNSPPHGQECGSKSLLGHGAAARLGLNSRRIADHVDDVVAPAGTRWSSRGPAALAALAAARRDA